MAGVDWMTNDLGGATDWRPIFLLADPFGIVLVNQTLAKLIETVTPAQAGVQKTSNNLDSCFRRNDVERLLQEAPIFLSIRDAPVAQLDRVPDYESVGRKFESCRARHFTSNRDFPVSLLCKFPIKQKRPGSHRAILKEVSCETPASHWPGHACPCRGGCVPARWAGGGFQVAASGRAKTGVCQGCGAVFAYVVGRRGELGPIWRIISH